MTNMNYATMEKHLAYIMKRIYTYLLLPFQLLPWSTMKYYVSLIIIYSGFINGSAWVFIYGLFHKWYETSKFAKKVMVPVGTLLGIDFHVEGEHFIQKEMPYIIVCNHQHALDITALMQIWDKFDKAAVTAKHELKWLGHFGVALQLAGTIFIPRKDKINSIKAINSAVDKAKIEKTSILIFPEGTRHMRSRDGHSMLPFKKGAFHMAVNAAVPILPVVISEYTFINEKEKIFGSMQPINESLEVTVNVLEPIETKLIAPNKIEDLVEQTRLKMIAVFERGNEMKLDKISNTTSKLD